jgi:nitrogen fixation/metabolism regulation signal transduction histidine kinase
VSLRWQFLVYLGILHLGVAAGALRFLWPEHRVWVLGLEAFLVVSTLVGLRLVRRMFEPLDLVRSGVQLMQESDFTTRFRERGAPELDELIRVYNGMADHLRDERARGEEQELFLERVLTASPSGVVTLDLDGRIATLNPSAERFLARALATSRSAAPVARAAEGGSSPFVGRRLADLGAPFTDALAQLEPGASRVLGLGRRRMRCQRGEFFDRGFARPFLLVEELTDELRRSEKAAYDLLIRTMSHEVNNTTGAVSSLLRSCARYGAQIAGRDRADFDAAIEVAIRRSAHLNQFVKRFADVVRLPPPRLEPTDLAALLDGLARLVGPELRERDVRLVRDVEPVPVVRLDPAQMEQALLNIVRNAAEAIGRDGTVTLRAARQGEATVLVVEDTGPGIAPEVRDRLFTPFFTTKENGQGIGLTLVREILEAHGFDFWLDGPPGGPTRFTIVMG